MNSPVPERVLPWPSYLKRAKARGSEQETVRPAERVETDEAVMARLCARDETALGELFDRYARLVFGIALRVIRDRGEAQDTVQEVFLQLYRSAEKFDPRKGTARLWISHLAVHKALDRRGLLSRRHFYDGTDLEVVADSLEGGRDLDSIVDAKLIGIHLQAALAELSPKQRITLEWHFFEQCSLREISERLGETLVSVRHHLYRGLDRLSKSAVIGKLRGE